MIASPDHLSAYSLLSGIYLALHFFTYVFVLRKLEIFELEKSIFLYHVIPAFLFCCAVLFSLVANTSEQYIAVAVALICVHGIYSLTFLELWTLSQISFSREVLIHVAKHGSLETAPPPRDLVQIGESKRSGRLDVMLRLRLIEQEDDHFHLTRRGRLVGSALATIAWLANLRETG